MARVKAAKRQRTRAALTRANAPAESIPERRRTQRLFQGCGDGSLGRNSAPVDSSTGHVVGTLGDGHPKEILSLPKQRGRGVPGPYVGTW